MKLLETAPNIRKRYQEQAAICLTDTLLKVLDINNKCDLNYKISNNKRLHLELALMQMCSIGIETPQSQKQPLPKPKPEAKPVDMNRPGNDIPGTFSIKDSGKPKKDTESDSQVQNNTATSPFTQEDLKSYWNEFASSLKVDFPHLFTTLTSREPVLKENWQIELEIDNRILEEELSLKKEDLLDFLKQKLDNFQIKLKTRIRENQKELKPYTDKEKFEKMAEKNPALNKLKEQLDLDIEY